MYEIVASNPWLVVIVVGGVVAIGCTAIVVVTEYLRQNNQAEIDASLKHAMLERGMSAADITAVLASTGDPEQVRRASRDEGVRVGLGKFKLELGSLTRCPIDETQHQPTT